MKLNSTSLFYAAGIAGGLAGLASGLPILRLVNCLLCGWLWIGGIAAVYLYNKRELVNLQSGQAAMVGAVAGVIAAIVAAILGLALGGMGFAASSLSDPQVSQYLDQVGGSTAVVALATSFGLNL